MITKLNAFLWIVLGILIFVWLVFQLKLIEMIIWVGFGIGCILTGVLQLNERKTISIT